MNTTNIDNIMNSNYDMLSSVLSSMRRLRDKINTSIPHIPYKNIIFEDIKNQSIMLTESHHGSRIANDCDIINKSIILEQNIRILKNRIDAIIDDIDKNQIYNTIAA
jgi:hypothetical protein